MARFGHPLISYTDVNIKNVVKMLLEKLYTSLIAITVEL